MDGNKNPKTKIHDEVYTQMDETWLMYEIEVTKM